MVVQTHMVGPVDGVDATPRKTLGRPPDHDAAVTRALLIKTARRAFGELGYAGTTYRVLAERAGLAPSAAYHYFPTKADLYAAVHEDVQEHVYTEWIEPALIGQATLAAKLDALLTAIHDMNRDDPTAAAFLATARVDTARHQELRTVHDALDARRGRLFDHIVDVGIGTGEIPPGGRALAGVLLEAMNLGLLELSAQPEHHRLAIEAYRRTVAPAMATLDAVG